MQGDLKLGGNEDEGFVRVGGRLNLLVLGSRVVFGVCTVGRELDTVAFELRTVSDRTHRGGVLIQKVDLFEGQPFGLKNDVNFLIIIRKRIN